MAPIARMLVAQTHAEFLRLYRVSAFSVTSLALPVVFFTFFGLAHTHDRIAGTNAGAYLLASFGAYGVTSVMIFSFGITVATERGQRIDRLVRASPLPPWIYLAAKVVNATAFASTSLVVLFVFGALAGGVRLEAAVWWTMGWRLVAGALPFIGLGFAIGYLAGPNSAPAVVNLIYLPLAFASGLFVPLAQLPRVVQEIAPYLPTYRYAQLAWSSVGAATDSLGSSVAWLSAYGAAFFLAAVLAYRRNEARNFA